MSNPFEEFAMVVGLLLVQEMDGIKEINLYSDSKSLVDTINSKENIKKTRLYKNKKFFIGSGIALNIYWSTDKHTYGLKMAHNISRKWNSKEKPLEPVIVDNSIVINYLELAKSTVLLGR